MNSLRLAIPVSRANISITCLNSSVKEHLSEDFNHRCAYCDDHEFTSGGISNYHIEHFAPQSKFRDLALSYNNLLYACPYCNRAKSNKWFEDSPHVSHNDITGFVDPRTEEYDLHLFRDVSGKIGFKTKLGESIYTELKLYLIRHQVNYLNDKLLRYQVSLQQIIEAKVRAGESPDREKAIYDRLCVLFSESFRTHYYQ